MGILKDESAGTVITSAKYRFVWLEVDHSEPAGGSSRLSGIQDHLSAHCGP